MKPKSKASKKGPKPKNRNRLSKFPKRAKFVKKITVATMLINASMFNSRTSTKKSSGRVYANRIPSIGRLIRNRNQIDFYFLTHLHANDLSALEPIIIKSKREGRPYNTIFIESPSILHIDKIKKEKEFSDLKKVFVDLLKTKEQLFALNANSKFPKGWTQEKIAEIDQIITDYLSHQEFSFENQQIFLAAKYNLIIKCAESYSIEEFVEKETPIQKSNQNSETYQKHKPKYFEFRGKRITQTIAHLEKSTTHPIRAVIILHSTNTNFVTRDEQENYAKQITKAEDYSSELHKTTESLLTEIKNAQNEALQKK